MMTKIIIMLNYLLFIYLLTKQLKGQLWSKREQKNEIQDKGKQRQNTATYIIQKITNMQ
jgi:hypothetical protein